MTSRKIRYWVILPKADGEFVAAMEEVIGIDPAIFTFNDAVCPRDPAESLKVENRE